MYGLKLANFWANPVTFAPCVIVWRPAVPQIWRSAFPQTVDGGHYFRDTQQFHKGGGRKTHHPVGKLVRQQKSGRCDVFSRRVTGPTVVLATCNVPAQPQPKLQMGASQNDTAQLVGHTTQCCPQEQCNQSLRQKFSARSGAGSPEHSSATEGTAVDSRLECRWECSKHRVVKLLTHSLECRHPAARHIVVIQRHARRHHPYL